MEVLAIHEEMLPDTAEEMTWVLRDYGMSMTLGRAVPRIIEKEVPAFVQRLSDAASLGDARRWLADCWCAVHPGGPLIVDVVAEQLDLEPRQVRHSNEVLKRRGNMSSATLPHIWSALLEEPEARPGQLILSLAFGPGLTMCGSVMRVTR